MAISGRTVLLAVGVVLAAGALGLAALYYVLFVHDFVLENRSGVAITDIELKCNFTTIRRLDRLDPDRTVRLPLGGGESEFWEVAWSDGEGRWIAQECIYVDVWADSNVLFQPGHRVNNAVARPTK